MICRFLSNVTIVFLLVLLYGCNKEEGLVSSEKEALINVEERETESVSKVGGFFSLRTNNTISQKSKNRNGELPDGLLLDPSLLQLRHQMIQEDKSLNVSQGLLSKYGNPYWERALVSASENRTEVITSIPLVREKDDYVSAVIIGYKRSLKGPTSSFEIQAISRDQVFYDSSIPKEVRLNYLEYFLIHEQELFEEGGTEVENVICDTEIEETYVDGLYECTKRWLEICSDGSDLAWWASSVPIHYDHDGDGIYNWDDQDFHDFIWRIDGSYLQNYHGWDLSGGGQAWWESFLIEKWNGGGPDGDSPTYQDLYGSYHDVWADLIYDYDWYDQERYEDRDDYFDVNFDFDFWEDIGSWVEDLWLDIGDFFGDIIDDIGDWGIWDWFDGKGIRCYDDWLISDDSGFNIGYLGSSDLEKHRTIINCIRVFDCPGTFNHWSDLLENCPFGYDEQDDELYLDQAHRESGQYYPELASLSASEFQQLYYDSDCSICGGQNPGDWSLNLNMCLDESLCDSKKEVFKRAFESDYRISLDKTNLDGTSCREYDVFRRQVFSIKLIEDLSKKGGNAIDLASTIESCFGAPDSSGNYIDCSNLDGLISFTFGLYAEQPVPNSRNPLTGNSLSEIECGHSFVSFSMNSDNIDKNITFGFHPFFFLSPYSAPNGPMKICDDGDHKFTSANKIELSCSDFNKSLKEAILLTGKEYHLFNYNCTDYAIDVAHSAGMNVASTTSAWIFNGQNKGEGRNPGDLGEDIKDVPGTKVGSGKALLTNCN